MKNIFSIFNNGLRKTAVIISRKASSCFSDTKEWDKGTYEEFEAALLGSDFGVTAAKSIVSKIKSNYELGKIKSEDDIFKVAENEVEEILSTCYKCKATANSFNVILLIGANGCGKTTSAGKLASLLKVKDNKVLLAACDTFRAAAVEQLLLWGKKTETQVISSKQGADPASVAFDAVSAAKARNCNYLIIDTAGRQNNKKSLLDELNKILKTIKKLVPPEVIQTMLVIDGSIGSNVLSQVKDFSSICQIDGIIATKLDGSYKGGMIVALAQEYKIPIQYIGLGEKVEDLQEFDPKLFAEAIFRKLDK